MIMKKSVLFMVLFAAFALAGCGWQETSHELETREEIAEVSDTSSVADSATDQEADSEESCEDDENLDKDAEETSSLESLEETASTEEDAAEEDATIIVAGKMELALTENGRIAEILNDSGTYTDCVGNIYQYTYQIPQFYAESESAKALNARIVQELGEIIETEYATMEADNSLRCPCVTYEVYEYGDIVSLLVTIDYVTDFMGYYAYSYHFAEDKELTNKDLLAMNEMSEELFVEEACRQAKEAFVAYTKIAYPDFTEEILNEFMTDSIENTTADLPMYCDSDGTLNAYVPLASIAGSSWYYSLFQF